MKELNWRLLVIGAFLCVIATAATPYVTLKLGQSVDLTMGGMFLAAYILANRMSSKELAIELNIIQTMIGMVQGIAFMVVILAAFFYIQTVFGRDIGFAPSYWQMVIWLFISANLGVFMGVVPRNSILKDRSLPWPASKAVLSVAQTLTDPEATTTTKIRRDVLTTSTGISGFLVFLRDGLGVIPSIVGNAALNMAVGLEMAALGIGMLVPLSVGLSGLLGTYVINVFGDKVARHAALSGVATEHYDKCMTLVDTFPSLEGAEKAGALEFLTTHGGKAVEFLQSGSHFKYVVQWMMWPATAMMIAAALTSVIIPVVQNVMSRKSEEGQAEETSLADEEIPAWWSYAGIAVSVVLLVVLTSTWFQMPVAEVLLAVAIQPVLIVAGLRVLGITGSGPVSLMANATQFLFGLIWPAQIRSNLSAAYISASPQAASENVVPAFWVARRLGGKFTTLILAQLFVIPIAALLTPLTLNMLQHTYGIGLNPGQLSAPTGLKIATLAIVMEKGISFMPHGALTASIIAIFVGIFFELLLAFKTKDEQGNETSRF
ncbi:MAG TPA: OPT/YSL family transporter, partial [Candidatus Ozemobacteraceae bacterium]|nr:OPT/YSL family transporter [Candidatus Ozemobacteraceae bacterium]